MSDFNNRMKEEEIYSKKVKAGKRRTYFFDVRPTKSSDYFITITESKRKIDGVGYDKHKIYIYKEDFNKFLQGLTDTIDHVKTVLLPDFDFDSFDRENESYNDYQVSSSVTEIQEEDETPITDSDEVRENREVDDFGEAEKW